MDDPSNPPNLIHLNFAPEAYRDAVALVTAYTYNDLDACEAVLKDAGHDLACALTIIVYASIRMFAEHKGHSLAETLDALGRTAAHFSTGGWDGSSSTS